MIDLTFDGETLVCVWPMKDQAAVGFSDELVISFVKLLGEPRAWAVAARGELIMLFPHQDMPDEIKAIAEQMTARHLVRRLEIASQSVPSN